MKKILLILFAYSFLVSCGPHRMSCGARGICTIYKKQILAQESQVKNIATADIKKIP